MVELGEKTATRDWVSIFRWFCGKLFNICNLQILSTRTVYGDTDIFPFKETVAPWEVSSRDPYGCIWEFLYFGSEPWKGFEFCRNLSLCSFYFGFLKCDPNLINNHSKCIINWEFKDVPSALYYFIK